MMAYGVRFCHIDDIHCHTEPKERVLILEPSSALSSGFNCFTLASFIQDLESFHPYFVTLLKKRHSEIF